MSETELEGAAESGQSWLGTSLLDMYRGQDPWSFSTPPIIPSKYHHVLYEIPVTLDVPPKPHYNANPKHWEDDYVRMPYSPNSLFLIKENGAEVVKPRWDVISEAFSKPINTVDDLEIAINSYNNRLPKFTALHYFFNEVISAEESQYYFAHILPGIIQLALRLPELVPGSLPLLRRHHCKSISLSQLQVASLLANAFLCTFLWRRDAGSYPGVNFVRLFTANQRTKKQSCVSEKFKCIFHYFRRVISNNPKGVITFERKYNPKNHRPRWDTLENNLGNTKIHISSTGTIEEGLGLLQVDFANKFIGGGILGYGAVQEEIRFSICPELIISRLFTEELGDSEAMLIMGVQRFSDYSGYSDGFKWEGNFNDETPFDDFGRRKTSIVVIDATRFTKSKDQFHPSAILRELNKAYTGFSSREKSNLAPVATGNWGCGAFKGDANLKSLIQLMACNAANRDLVYYSFGDTELRDQFYNMHLFLANNKVTICQLWRYLCRFCTTNLPADKLYSYIQQCHFDLKSQPSLKQFFCFNVKKGKGDISSAPSTSTFIEDKVKITTTPSPEAETKSESPPIRKFIKTSTPSKKTRTDHSKIPDNSEEIFHVINLIDGVEDKSKPLKESTSTELKSTQESSQILNNNESVIIPMEVDNVEPETKATTSFMGERKKKITDYFTKMSTCK